MTDIPVKPVRKSPPKWAVAFVKRSGFKPYVEPQIAAFRTIQKLTPALVEI